MTASGSPPVRRSSAPGSIPAPRFDDRQPLTLSLSPQAGRGDARRSWREGGYFALAEAAMPTFTNPNNMSIVTGVSPAVHGISGNFTLDRETGAEIMMTDPDLLRSDTILALMSQAGIATAAVTAKDKL